MSFKLDMGKFKKVSSDDHHSILRHDDGHEIRIAHKALSPKMRKGLAELPSHGRAASGAAAQYAEGGDVSKDKGPAIDPRKAKEIQESANEPGWAEARRNIKKLTGYAKGGEVNEGKAYAEESMILRKEEIDKRNKEKASRGEAQESYPSDIEETMRETDVTPKSHKMAEGGEVADEGSDEIHSSQAAPEDNKPVTINVNSAPLASPGQTPPAPQGMAPAAAPEATPEEGGFNPGALSKQLTASQPGAPAQEPQAPAPTNLHAYNKQYNVAGKLGEVEQNAAAEAAGQYRGQAEEQAKLGLTYQKHHDEITNEIKNTIQDMKDKHIDANRFLGNRDTSQKILSGIGLVLGGFAGGGHSNQALDFLNRQIDRDIEAQKADMSNRNTLLGALFKQSGDLDQATSMARAIMLSKAYDDTQALAADATSDKAKLNAQAFQAQLEAQAAPLIQQNALKATIKSAGEGKPLSVDPAQLVTQLVPSDKQKEVFGQIEAAQNTKRMGKTIIEAFEQATKENTALKTGFGKLRTPASVYALHQAMQPTFKDLEGTVRQAAMDNTFKNITPEPGDTEHTVDTKRRALVDYLQSKASAPMAKGFGIDLDKFESTKPDTNPVKVQEVERIGPDGKIAIFDAGTKKFLRFK